MVGCGIEGQYATLPPIQTCTKMQMGNSYVDLFAHVLIQSILCSEIITILHSTRSLVCLPIYNQIQFQDHLVKELHYMHWVVDYIALTEHPFTIHRKYHLRKITSYMEIAFSLSISEIHPHSTIRGSKYQGNYPVCLTDSLRLFLPSSVWSDHGFLSVLLETEKNENKLNKHYICGNRRKYDAKEWYH